MITKGHGNLGTVRSEDYWFREMLQLNATAPLDVGMSV